jgi:predicted dehydrogenase
MVGFNRRFAPLFTDLLARFGNPPGPSIARYLVNAGRLDSGSWYQNTELEGSRFVGEGGHFIDALTAWIRSEPTEVYADALAASGDVSVNLRFADGSLGMITYLSGGNARFPKETLDVSAGGRSARLDNFTKTSLWTGNGRSVKRALAGQDKGQAAQLRHFVRAVSTGAPMPIALSSLVSTTRATLAVATSAASRRPISLDSAALETAAPRTAAR